MQWVECVLKAWWRREDAQMSSDVVNCVLWWGQLVSHVIWLYLNVSLFQLLLLNLEPRELNVWGKLLSVVQDQKNISVNMKYQILYIVIYCARLERWLHNNNCTSVVYSLYKSFTTGASEVYDKFKKNCDFKSWTPEVMITLFEPIDHEKCELRWFNINDLHNV